MGRKNGKEGKEGVLKPGEEESSEAMGERGIRGSRRLGEVD